MSEDNPGEYFLTCRDYTVSGKEFDLYWNEEKDILKTFPEPSSTELPSYYKSEDYISHTDSSKSITDKIYQKVKNYMLSFKLKLIENYFSSANILDVGAGTGDFLKAAKDKNWNVSGVEPNSKARSLASKKGIELSASLENFENERFDVITLWHVLEHLPDLENKIEKFYSLLQSDGVILIAVPNFKSYDAKYYKKYWAAYDVPRHLWHFSEEGIKRIFKKYGFKFIETKPLLFDSFYVSLLSEKYKAGSTNYLNAFARGLLSNLKARKNNEYSSKIYIFQKNN